MWKPSINQEAEEMCFTDLYCLSLELPFFLYCLCFILYDFLNLYCIFFKLVLKQFRLKYSRNQRHNIYSASDLHGRTFSPKTVIRTNTELAANNCCNLTACHILYCTVFPMYASDKDCPRVAKNKTSQWTLCKECIVIETAWLLLVVVMVVWFGLVSFLV